MWKWLEYLLYGPGVRQSATPLTQEIAPLLPQRSSQVFDSHILTEAGGAGGKGRVPQAVSLAWDEGRAYGFNVAPQSWLGMTPRERKETLLSIFLTNPWASNCIDTIALYLVSGGFSIEPRVEKPDERQRDEIEAFLLRINEDWDFNQYVYDQISDEDIFGEAFTEFTLKDGKPYQLFPLDCLTMDSEHDRYGRVMKYKQQLSSTSVVNDLDPRTIVRWWNPHKRAKIDPFSHLERVQDAILLDKKMVNWMTTFFQKGAKFPYTIEGFGDQDEADRYVTWHRANYTGEKNAQTPIALWGAAKITPSGKGSIDIDFEKGLDRMQSIVLSAFHVPPSIACIADVGNRLTDMSDGQRKILQYIACDPRRKRFFEKFNYRLIHPYFGTDYYVSMRYADFRDDKSLAEVADIRIKNGTSTQNEVRQEMGKEAYEKGGDVAIVWSTKEIVPVPRLEDLEDEQRMTAQATLDTAQANADMAKTKAKQAKEPPEPQLEPLQKVQQNGVSNGTPPDEKKETLESIRKRIEIFRVPPSRPVETAEDLMHDLSLLIDAAQKNKVTEAGAARPKVLERQTGMMLALMLDASDAQQLALPGGEPVEDLHITLAYLGDMEDLEDGFFYPHTAPEPINFLISTVASTAQPLSGMVGGIGRFYPAETDTTPVIALVDIPGLTELRTELVDAINQANYFVADNHGYTPHITLSYISSDAPMPIKTVPPLPLRFDTVWLCVGDDRIPFKLGSSTEPPTKEHNAQQETNSQDGATDALTESEDQDQGGGSLHPAQKTDTGDIRTHRESSSSGPGVSNTGSHKDELSSKIATLFAEMKRRGGESNPTPTTALAAYTFTDQEKDELAHKLAEARLAATQYAYKRDKVAVGYVPVQIKESVLTKASDLLSWGYEQVSSIVQTMQEQLANFLDQLSDVDISAVIGGWIDRYATWKAPQIANATWGTGAHDGTRTAINEILDLLSQPDSELSQSIRVRVVPGESSGDFCREWAGKSVPITESDSLPYFPAHPGCVHGLEVYVDDTGDEEL